MLGSGRQIIARVNDAANRCKFKCKQYNSNLDSNGD